MFSDEILETKDVADLLKIHVRTVARLVERGEIKSFRVGDLLRFRRSAIDEYIREQEEKSQIKQRERKAGK